MEAKRKTFWIYIEQALPWLVLAILLTYTYSKFFMHPYGFRFGTQTGRIMHVFIQQPEPTLRVGDQLVQVGPVRWEDFYADLRVTFFKGAKPGDVVPVVVVRNDQTLTIPWTYPGLNPGDFYDQLPSEWVLAYFFWIAGTLTILLLRPKDERWLLLAGFNFLTAIWVIVGSGNSAYHTWYSALVLRVAIWLCVPVYLHLHWVFPRPLGKLPLLLVGGVYAIALALVIAQGLQLLPKGLYYLGFIVALLGSLILLIAHAVRQPQVRRDLRFLLVAIFLALIPSIGIGLASGIVSIPPGVSSLGLLSFPLIPFGYLYATYRRQLGEFELRLNRLISLYLFLILLGTLMVPLVVVTTTRIQSPEGTMVLEITGGLLVILITVFGFPLFQNFVERRWLGIRLSPENLLEVYSARITTSSSLSGLVQLLRDEVLPSLLVRQFVFLQFDGNSTKVLLATGAIAEDIPVGPGLSPLMAQMGKYCFPHLSDSDPSWPWVRLVIPLRIGEGIIGLWLFGRRDPDDVYSQAELPILRSLADQTAIALSNILQTERLRALYQSNINRYEQERFRLALDLHDSVLNQAAAMLMNLDSSSLSPGFQEAYDRFTQRLREIVSDLRPPMLNYGLKPALEALADNLMERSGDTVSVVVNIQADEVSYPQNIEQHLFRIVQEACENALRHGQARRISISGQLGAQEVDLSIEDDGIGFDMGQGLELEDLLAHKHFGLAGMVERAKLLDAEINIATAPRAGTRIRVAWNSSVG
ncbi:MAG: hypothetical protein PHS96_07945 [Anaerolineales bacterium]|nr:hypothetical protein [Anaerolineales bacterium]